MRCEMICFSPTGNSRAAAERLAAQADGAAILDLTDPALRATTPQLRDNRLMVLVCPVYAHSIPQVVSRWLRSLPRSHGPACVVCTYGCVGVGNALYDAARLLTRMGRTVIGCAALPGPHSYACAQTRFSMKCERDWDGLDAFFAKLLQKADGEATAVSPARGFEPVQWFPQAWGAKLAVRHPWADTKACSHCGRCQSVCPVGAAEAKSGCIRCGACVHNCEQGARKLKFRCNVPPLYISIKMKEKRPPCFIL